ncbi:MAG: hypothetical protein K8F58_00745 [Bauldia sp.]|nr:hypothetical protein [Bauldia sp.]
MNLLCERQQSSAAFTLVPLQFGGGVMFKLWAKVELDDDEFEMLRKYRFEDALLIADDWVATLRHCFRVSLTLGFALWIVLILFFSWTMSATLAFLAVALITGLYYNELRGNIYVRDLVHGRTFRCFSIVELIRKEHYLKGLSMYLRQVLESARNWDGQEVIAIPPLTPEQAKLLVIEGIGR